MSKYIKLKDVLSQKQEPMKDTIWYPKPGTLYVWENVTDESVFEDIQYTFKGRTDRQVVINGSSYDVTQGFCGGCKSCNKCEKVVPSRMKDKQCDKSCGGNMTKTECSVKFYYLKKGSTRYLYSSGEHTHKDPPPRKVPSNLTKQIENVFNNNPTLTTKDVVRGFGLSTLPALLHPALTNKDRIMKIRTRALASRYGKSEHSSVDVTRIYDYLEVIHDKNMDEWENIKVKNSDVSYLELLNPYVRSIIDNDELFSVHVGTPLKSFIIPMVAFLVIDVKHASKSGPCCHHFGIAGFLDSVLKAGMLGRCYISNLNTESYRIAFLSFLERIMRDIGRDELEHYLFESMEGLVADFSIAQKEGVRQAIESLFPGRGDEFIEKKYKGCHVHYKRSVLRLINATGMDEITGEAFKKLAFKVLECKSVDKIKNILNGLVALVPQTEGWSFWWQSEDMILMLISDGLTTNPVESLNCAAVATGGNLPVELEVNYREDLNFDYLILNSLHEVPYSYRKKKQNLKDIDVSHPPEKRREGIQVCKEIDLEAFEDFVSDLKKNSLEAIKDFAQDDINDDDYIQSESSQDVVSPPQKKRDDISIKKKKVANTPKRKKANKKASEQVSSQSVILQTPPKVSLSRQLRNVQENAENGSPLSRNARSKRFSLDGLLK